MSSSSSRATSTTSRGAWRRIGIPRGLRVMLSHGGVATPETASRHPIRMLESGPAAGALAAAKFGATAGQADLLSFDMGGTTAKLCMIEDGRPLVTNDFEVDRVNRLKKGSGLPVKTQVLDMIEIGVGGGSIARITPLGLLAVGPRSAGASPGPACYGAGRGGADGHRRRPGARLPRSRLLPRRRRRSSTPSGRARRSSARSPSRSGSTSRGRRSGSTRSSTRTWPAPRACTSSSAATTRPGWPSSPSAAPARCTRPGWRARSARARVIVPAAAGVMSSVGVLTAPMAFDFVRSWPVVVGDEIMERAERAVRRDGARGRGGARRVRRRGGRDHATSAAWTCATAARASRSRSILDEAASRTPDGLRGAFEAAYERRHGRRGPVRPGRGHQLARDRQRARARTSRSTSSP